MISSAGSVTARPTLGRGVFLVAGRNMNGPLFARTVILITQYDDHGTVGLIINRPLQIPAAHALPPLSGLSLKSGMVHMGGPVAVNALQLLVRAASAPDGAEPVFGDVYLVNDSASLKSILSGNTRITRVRLYAGYAGWAPGQLEKELLHGDWYLWSADADSIFNQPAASVWDQLIGRAAAQWVWWKPPAARLPPPVSRTTGGAVIDTAYIETP
jgi:putative transcriptional regulator